MHVHVSRHVPMTIFHHHAQSTGIHAQQHLHMYSPYRIYCVLSYTLLSHHLQPPSLLHLFSLSLSLSLPIPTHTTGRLRDKTNKANAIYM